MGNTEGKVPKKQTNVKLKEQFFKLSNNKPLINRKELQNSWKHLLDDSVYEILEARLCPNENSEVNLEAYSTFVNSIFRSNIHDKAEAIVTLISDAEVATRLNLLKLYTGIVRSVICVNKLTENKQWISWKNGPESLENAQRLADYFISLSGNDKEEINSSDIRATLTAADVFLSLVFGYLFGESITTNLFPKWVKLKGDSGMDLPRCSLLTLEDVLFLNSEVPVDCQDEWRLLFSTKIHGESFARFSGQITNQGPTLIIIEDKHGYVFGGFAPASWTMNPKFYGDSSCFLFTLRPKFLVYRASNFNDNFQYLITGQQTLPNGLGMGGREEYFGLFLSAEFGRGICNDSCTTFRPYKRMSKEKEFSCKKLEVWGVGTPPPTAAELGERSILDSNIEAKAMLAMAGKKTYSDGLRDEPSD